MSGIYFFAVLGKDEPSKGQASHNFSSPLEPVGLSGSWIILGFEQRISYYLLRALVSGCCIQQFLHLTIMNPCQILSSMYLHFVSEEIEAKKS